jgi:hypothetical protein
MIPFSVEATFTLALILQKSWGAIVSGWGFSTSFRSPARQSTVYLLYYLKILDTEYCTEVTTIPIWLRPNNLSMIITRGHLNISCLVDNLENNILKLIMYTYNCTLFALWCLYTCTTF